MTKFLNWIKHNLGAPDRQLVEENQCDSNIQEPYEFEDSDDYINEDDSFEYEEDDYSFDENDFEYDSEF